MRCVGRLVSDVKGVGAIPFENGGFFHLPIQCDRIGKCDQLCDTCLKKRERTDAKVALITGSSLKGAHPSYLHGIVTGPIPFWSHIYDGDWFRLKVSSGAIVSDDNMAKVKKAIADLPVPPEPEKKARKKTAAVAVAVAVAVAAAVAPTAVPVTPTAAPPVPPKPKRAVVKSTVKSPVPPVVPLMAALVEKPEEIDEENVVKIVVRKVEVDGRTVYLDSSTDKVYDMTCKYLGRLKDDSIVSFPDSDDEK